MPCKHNTRLHALQTHKYLTSVSEPLSAPCFSNNNEKYFHASDFAASCLFNVNNSGLFLKRFLISPALVICFYRRRVGAGSYRLAAPGAISCYPTITRADSLPSIGLLLLNRLNVDDRRCSGARSSTELFTSISLLFRIVLAW